jgi:signal transduction histidine kinase
MAERTLHTFRTFSLRLAYISRSVGIPLCFAVSATHYAHLGLPWYLWIPPLYHSLVHPHLMYWGGKQFLQGDRRHQVDLFSMYAIEAVLVGHYLAVMNLGLWPSFTWFGGYTMNNLAYGGPSLTWKSAIGCAVGFALTAAILGFHFDPSSTLLTSTLAFVYMVFYTGLLAGLLNAGLAEMGQTTIAVQAGKELIELRTTELEKARGELEARNTRLQELDREKTHFFQNISHELRTPLTLILNPLDEALRKRPEDHEIEVASRNARRLLRLVNQLLDFQKLSANKSVERAPVDLVRFTWVCADYFRSACSTKEVDFRVTVDGEPLVDPTKKQIAVLGQTDALEKVVFNFLSNALKFTPNRGRIALALEVHDHRVRVGVTDSGPGIKPEDLGKLFQLFSQVDQSTTRKYEGTGLGLALAKELTAAMGGEVGVDSAPGKGSTFWAEFPVLDGPIALPTSDEKHTDRKWMLADAVVAAPTEVPSAEPPVGDGSLVLVVDDLADMRDLIRGALQSVGYRVITAENGRAGLATAKRVKPDLVITDWMMPEMHGPALIRHLQSDESLSGTPVILLTAKSDEESRLIGTEIGADAFLGKPFVQQELLSVARNLLHLKQKEKEVTAAYAELRGAQAQLVLAQKLSALGRLVAGVAHELNNPTNFVQSNFEVSRRAMERVRDKLWEILPDGDDGAEARALFEPEFDTIAQCSRHHQMGTQRISDIVQSLRAFSRHDQAATQRADLHEVLDDTLTILGSELQGIAITQDRGTLPRLTCNPSQLGQVLMNLLTNAAWAARHTKAADGPKIAISTRSEGDDVLVDIADNGPGIDPSVADTLFDPFVTTKPPGEGTGMGLAISWVIVRDHGGELRSASTAAGATFTMRLPAGVASDLGVQPVADASAGAVA